MICQIICNQTNKCKSGREQIELNIQNASKGQLKQVHSSLPIQVNIIIIIVITTNDTIILIITIEK